VEALYNGLPVISTNCPSGPEEILNKGEFGSLVPPNDPSALADSIVAFFFEEKIDSSYINNIKKWGNSFNYKKVAKLYLNIIFSNK
jgi:glycosyltransferase involved in cell wall biosynthesis